MNPTYVVKGEHTLGFVYAEQPDTLNVLHGSVLRGGHDWKNGPTFLGDDWRPATLADFDDYRVSPKGHLT